MQIFLQNGPIRLWNHLIALKVFHEVSADLLCIVTLKFANNNSWPGLQGTILIRA